MKIVAVFLRVGSAMFKVYLFILFVKTPGSLYQNPKQFQISWMVRV
jgi:hypothetical protein